jgi:ATP-dependent helicase HrpB
VGALPIDAILDEVVESLRQHPNLVIEAPPGAGKTTRVPPALLRLNLGDVVVLEPRRLAARMAARRVAQDRGEEVGQTVGYQVRFEQCGGRDTRIWFCTEGVLTQRFLSDPELRRAGVVVLDEFHERHVDTDMAIALLRRLQVTRRPELRIVVMSATLESAAVARYLGECPSIRSEGRLFPVAVEYTPHSAAALEDQVSSAFDRVAAERGDVLTFLPGAAELRRAAGACSGIAARAGFDVVMLHGDLPPAEQDRAVNPGPRPKLILSTNVAETSITIEGITAVIDSGLARVAVDSPWTGLPSLNVARISKASARQRAGRAGRVRAGRVTRLYSEDDYVRRPEHDTPEIQRRELSHVLLDLLVIGTADIEWFDPPPAASIVAGWALLERLGAVSGRALTDTGREIARLPLHPRLARIVVEAARRGSADDGAAAAAVLSAGEQLDGPARHHAESDVLVLMEREWMRDTRRLYEQVRRVVGQASGRRGASGSTAARSAAPLLTSILAGFPDRLAKRRQGTEYLLAGGGSAELSTSSAVQNHDFILALDVDVRRDRKLPLIRLASAVDPEWLIDLFPEGVEDRSGVEWNRSAERVDAVSALVYDGLAIEESRGAVPDPEAAAELLAAKAQEEDLARFLDRDQLEAFRARVEFAGLARVAGDEIRQAIRDACTGLRSFAELAKSDLLGAIRARVPGIGRLNELAPERITLAGGRPVRVHYEHGKPPWIASRLQDFFGMTETPRIAGQPVVIHLLAPNQRPVQTTTDLAGFWQRLYPQIRKELSRKYPKHKWPERPV